ncbi:MerR family transcriptional regulator [Amorphoplanes digitatis]|uniref:DNA-binding transcriptional MerR regulator n=1 Tax=Actinoplanes digitatis TaxID=1868 RepID=A0A7W7I579_9ACTN|nr:MerR family transcriptional regulator [Actinoplanes digitatis]MBB4766676.1 DNA-binding transcriptional MerR regulator [Actinoplanes digitatis]GID96178.1 MerR family transcriptional regulator [Actinoplanes digitatis]
MSRYTPGEVAQRTGLSLDTLRYYERIGLLDGVDRTPAGRREYSDDDLGWLEILRCLRETGMPIQQMRRYADLCRDDGTIAERIALLEQHDNSVRDQIAMLQSQRAHLRGKIDYYRSRG